VYETVMWTDNIVESPQREERIDLGLADFRGDTVWEARSRWDYRFVSGRYVEQRNERTWFARHTLDPLRYEALQPNGGASFEIDVTTDSVFQRWGSEGKWRQSSHARAGGLFFLGFSYAHAMAVISALPLTEMWAGTIGGRRMAVVAREDITVPAGTFTCWRLEAPEDQDGTLLSQRREWRAWVAVDQPLVIRTETGPVGDRYETHLVSFKPASRASAAPVMMYHHGSVNKCGSTTRRQTCATVSRPKIAPVVAT
jgi:hypothetical protein